MENNKIRAITTYLFYCYQDMTIAEIRKLLKRLVKLGVKKLGNIELTNDYINNINQVQFNA